MAVKFFKENNVWIVQKEHDIREQGVPAGDYRRITSGNDILIVGTNTDTNILIPLTLVTTIQKNRANETYASLAEFITATEDFFVNASGDGGISGLTNQTIPVKGVSQLEDSLITFNSTLDRYESEKAFYAPTLESDPGTLVLGNLNIDSANHSIGVENKASGQKGIVLSQNYDNLGSSPACTFNLSDEKVIDRQLISNEGQPSVPYSYVYTFQPSENIWWSGLRVIPEESGLFKFTIRSNDEFGEIITTQESFNFQQGDVGVEVLVPLTNAFALFENETIHTTLEGAKIFGGSIGSTWFPHFKSIEQDILSIDEIITGSDQDASPFQFVVDENNMASNSNTKLPTQSSVKYYVDNLISSGITLQGEYDAVTNTPNLEITPTGVMKGYLYVITVAGDFFSKSVTIGDALISKVDDPQVESDWIIMCRGLDAATVKILYESNANTNAFTDTDQVKVGNLTGTNSGDVSLSLEESTQESLDLTGQVLNTNQVTQSTDGVMSSEDKLKFDNLAGNGVGDHWVSGLDALEQSPKDQTVNYTAGTYLINGVIQTIVSGGSYDLENGYGGTNHYTGLTSSQHRFVALCVDVDLVVKSIGGAAAEKNDVPDLPILPIDSVCVALIEIKVDGGSFPKSIGKKDITDTRNSPAFNTDEFVKSSVDDLGSGYLIDKLSNNGNVTFTLENQGGTETIKADTAGISVLPSIEITVNANIDGVDVSSLSPQGILYTNMSSNRELRSLVGGIDNQIVNVVNLAENNIKVKNNTGSFQKIRTEGGVDKTFGDYGGCTLIYNATSGYWFLCGIVI